MSTKTNTIKIVKREQRKDLAKEDEQVVGELKTERQARREMLETITSWIEEQRQSKRNAPSLPSLDESCSA